MARDTDDPNIFAVLTPYRNSRVFNKALKLKANSIWFQEAWNEDRDFVATPPPGKRADTPGREPRIPGWSSGLEDCLIITFDKPLKNAENGIQLGTDTATSDILLGRPGSRAISARQCNIILDKGFRVFLHDYRST